MKFAQTRELRVTVEERIAKFGFKRWYERALMESHVFLVTALLGAILAFTGVELISERDGGVTRVMLGIVAVLIGGVIAGASVTRYLRMLMQAINLGENATCRGCGTYAKFDILASGRIRSHGPNDRGSLWMKVKCKKCGAEWRVE
jgi:hypothetical protein